MTEVKFASLSRFVNLSSNLTCILNLNSNLTPKFYFKIALPKYKFTSHYPYCFGTNRSLKNDQSIHWQKIKFAPNKPACKNQH
ncbi:hypothetical protein H740_08861 [Campylobacter showae CC57C]|uniref:Uncharacterized protein n=1 Tax=Campylobacter showae CC57C TaxID=1073353 RepID=M3JBC2_9BACT|nr:hypothetical protein H740_08861 [Campylobacter showae CC57C]